MRLDEMNKQHMALLQSFNDELERAGWAVEDFGEMLAAGMSVNPEGMALLTGEAATIEAHLSLTEGELRLFVRKRETDQLVRLIVTYGQNLHRILHSLISEQDRMDTSTFPQFLLESSRLAEQIWFVDHEGTRFLLDFPPSADG